MTPELIEVGRVRTTRHNALAVSDGGDLVVLGGPWDGEVELVEVATNTVRAQTSVPGSRGARVAAITRDRAAVALGSGGHHDLSGHLFWWDLADGSLTELPTGEVRELRWIALREDGRYLAAVGRTPLLGVVDLTTRALMFSGRRDDVMPRWLGGALVFRSAQGGGSFRPDDRTEAAATEAELRGRWDKVSDARGAWEQDGAIRIFGNQLLWAAGGGEHELPAPTAFERPAVSGDGRSLAATVGAEVVVWTAR